jgi:hypothetical protein
VAASQASTRTSDSAGHPHCAHASFLLIADLQFAGRYTYCNNAAAGLAADWNTLLFEDFLQFAGLIHLTDDVTTADELAFDVELRDRRPI